jgi:hypothetical protein
LAVEIELDMTYTRNGFAGKIYSDLKETTGPHCLSERPHPLEKLSDDDLLLRFSELADSMWLFGPDLEVTRFLVPDLPIWKSGIECAAEIERRKLATDNNFSLVDERIGIDSKSIRARMRGQRFPRKGTKTLAKFTERRYVSDFVQKGHILFSPATRFIDESLSIAQQDDEMEFKSYLNPTGITISTKENPEEHIPIIDSTNIETSVRMGTNYYLFSATYGPDPRHFIDFRADACVFITNPKEFIRRVMAAVRQNRIDWKCSPFFLKIGYIDKYVYTKHARPSMAKDIKYWYQFETRMVLLPPKGRPASKLEPFVLSIGSLSDITETFEIA